MLQLQPSNILQMTSETSKPNLSRNRCRYNCKCAKNCQNNMKEVKTLRLTYKGCMAALKTSQTPPETHVEHAYGLVLLRAEVEVHSHLR